VTKYKNEGNHQDAHQKVQKKCPICCGVVMDFKSFLPKSEKLFEILSGPV
jgi:hypothetical protein